MSGLYETPLGPDGKPDRRGQVNRKVRGIGRPGPDPKRGPGVNNGPPAKVNAETTRVIRARAIQHNIRQMALARAKRRIINEAKALNLKGKQLREYIQKKQEEVKVSPADYAAASKQIQDRLGRTIARHEQPTPFEGTIGEATRDFAKWSLPNSRAYTQAPLPRGTSNVNIPDPVYVNRTAAIGPGIGSGGPVPRAAPGGFGPTPTSGDGIPVFSADPSQVNVIDPAG